MVAGMLTADGYRVTAARACPDLARETVPPRPFQLLIASPSAETARQGQRLLKQNADLRFLCVRPGEESPAAVSWLAPERQASLLKPYALSELVRLTRKLLDA